MPQPKSSGLKPTSPPNQGSGGKRPVETAKRSCAHLQKQLDDSLTEIETLNKQLEVAEEERKILRERNTKLNNEVDRIARTCRQLRHQRDNVHSSLQISIANTNKLSGCLHGVVGQMFNPYQTDQLIDGLPNYHFEDKDDEITF